MGEDRVPEQIVYQRVRNRLIEYLAVAGSFEQQREYQARVPAVSVPNEIINQWEDWTPGANLLGFGPPVFTSDELAALKAFGITWERVVRGTPKQLPSLEETLTLPQWEELRAAAEAALNVFERRGRLPEHEPL